MSGLAQNLALATRWRIDAGEGHNDLFEALCARYSETHRHYHTLNHLTAVFALLDQCTAQLRNPRAVAFAVWYHDVIYDSARSDNEEQSAALARAALTAMGYADLDPVVSMILATKNHTATPNDADEALFLDADFAILGTSRPRYAVYTQQVRAEYCWLTEDQWRAGRGAFLAKATAAPRLFHTDMVQTKLGAQARSNMAWEAEQLR